MALRACPSCARHVRTTDSVCPFCSTEQPEAPAAKPRTMGALGTRAAMLFGATAVVTACSSSTVAMYGAPGPGPDPTVDAGADGSIIAMYGAPAPDAAPDARSDASPDAGLDASTADGETPDGGPVPLYGAPGPGK